LPEQRFSEDSGTQKTATVDGIKVSFFCLHIEHAMVHSEGHSLLKSAGMRTAYALRTCPFLKENVRFSKKTVEQKCQDGIFETTNRIFGGFEEKQ